VVGYVVVELIDGCAHIEHVSAEPGRQGQGPVQALINEVERRAACRVHLFVQCPDLDFRKRQCVGYDHRWGGRTEFLSSGLPLV
jgi:hypothetical protein